MPISISGFLLVILRVNPICVKNLTQRKEYFCKQNIKPMSIYQLLKIHIHTLTTSYNWTGPVLKIRNLLIWGTSSAPTLADVNKSYDGVYEYKVFFDTTSPLKIITISIYTQVLMIKTQYIVNLRIPNKQFLKVESKNIKQ